MKSAGRKTVTAIEGPPQLAASFILPAACALLPREQRQRSTLSMLHTNGRIDHASIQQQET
jgi:hypothetical protein